jgi:hypothetical protein
VIEKRRRWPALPFWIGDEIIKFRPLLVDGTRTEWLRIGKTINGDINIEATLVVGDGSSNYIVKREERACHLRLNQGIGKL